MAHPEKVPLLVHPIWYTESRKLRKDVQHVRCFYVIFDDSDVVKGGCGREIPTHKKLRSPQNHPRTHWGDYQE
jgi:hypothetical protein